MYADLTTKEAPKGALIFRNGKHCAGTHLLVDYYEASNLSNYKCIRKALTDAAHVAHATLLHIHLHKFEGSGVSGIAVLAESHISVHTWPEYGLAVFDIFMCGSCNPHLSLPILEHAFTPKKINIREFFRGQQ